MRPGSRPSTASRWRTGSRSGSAGDASGGSHHPCHSGRSSGRRRGMSDGKGTSRVVATRRRRYLPVAPDGNSSWEDPALRVPRGRPLRRQESTKWARNGARFMHAKIRWPRHLVHRQIQPLAPGQMNAGNGSRSATPRSRPVGEVRGRIRELTAGHRRRKRLASAASPFLERNRAPRAADCTASRRSAAKLPRAAARFPARAPGTSGSTSSPSTGV